MKPRRSNRTLCLALAVAPLACSEPNEVSPTGGGGTPTGGAGAAPTSAAASTAVGGGGTSPVAGSSGSAGDSARAGSSAGGAGGGGATGNGGAVGANGGTGESGGGNGTSGGNAGSAGTSAKCQMVKAEYAAELENQLGCKPGAASQCTDRVASAPGCECLVFIEPSDPFAIEHLSNVANAWFDNDCSMPTCPARCPAAAAGTCQADPNFALGGRCVMP